ncbi:MAG: serine/threonine-protein kinase [Acidobacteriota bacterium]
MTTDADRSAEIYRLFAEIVEHDPAERTRALDELKDRDPELAAEVEALLAADDSEMDLAEVAWGDVTPSIVGALAGPAPERTVGLPAGFRLGGYTIVRRISSGGMAVVYEAEQDEPRRRVALKLLRELGSEEAARRFRVEAAVLGALEHPGIARVYEVGLGTLPEGETVRFIAMEYVDGAHVDDHVRPQRPDVEAVVELIAQVAEAVGHAHRRGIVHRDLKPGNCLVDREGRPKVIDFGIASIRDAELSATVAPTATGEVLGTVVYMAPEQLAGNPDAIGPPTDVHALGTLLYELLAGRRPHDTGTQSTAVLLAREAEAPRLRTLVPDLPRDVEVIVHAALEPDPKRRYPDAEAFAADLRRFVRHEPIEARPPSALYRLEKWSRRNRAPLKAMGATLGLLAVLAAAAWGVRAWSDHRVAERRESDLATRLAVVQDRMRILRDESEDQAAAALFDEFVSEPGHAGSRAVTRAWLDHGTRLFEDERLADAVRAFGFAYTSAPTSALRAESLERLLRTHHRQGDLLAADAVLALLEEQHPGRALPGLDDLHFETAVARADLTAARARLSVDDAREPLLDLLASAAILASFEPAADVTTLAVHDHDADGRDELLVALDKKDLAWLTASGQLTTLSLPEGLAGYDLTITGEHLIVIPRADGGGTVLALVLRDATTAENVLAEVHATELVERFRWAGESVFSLASLTSSSGATRVFAGSAWAENHFWEIDLARGEVTSAHPDTEAWESYITTMATMDLDADGDEELVVGLGPPEGFELRAYDTEGPLRLLARCRIGYPHALVGLPTGDGRSLAAVSTSRWHKSKTMFPEGDHGGPPRGIYLHGLAGDSLIHVGSSSLDPTDTEFRHLHAGDIDGDGLADLVHADARQVRLLRQLPSDAPPSTSFAGLLVEGWEVRSLAQLDADPELEVVILRTDLSWSGPVELRALGLEGEPLPVRERSKPTAMRSRGSAARQRAQQLAGLGLTDIAAESLEHLSSFEAGGKERSRLLLEAAALHQVSSDGSRDGLAAEARLAAVRADPDDVQLWREGIEILWHQGRFDEATPLLEERLADGGLSPEMTEWTRKRLEALAPLGRPELEEVLVFDGKLEDSWQLEQPLLVRHDPRGGALDIDAFSGTEELLRLPLRRVGEDLGISVEAELEHFERGSIVEILLRPRGSEEAALGVRWSGFGWGGFLFRDVGSFVQGKHEQLGGWVDTSQPNVTGSNVVSLLARPGEGTWRTLTDSRGIHRSFVPKTHEREDEAWELVVRTRSSPSIDSAWAHLELREIRLQGLRVDRSAPSIGERRGVELAELLSGTRREPAALRNLLAEPVSRSVAAGMLRLAPAEVARPLQEALGTDGFLELLHEAWGDAIESHLAEPHVVAGLRTTPHLVSELAGRDPHALDLLIARGQARWLAGDVVEARRDLALAGRHVARGKGSRRCFDVESTLAEIAATLEDVDEARERMEEALRCAPAEDLGRDRLLRRVVLRPLLDGTETDS